jgi:hypothetical protein
MNLSKQRFDIHLRKLKPLLKNAADHYNPALSLYMEDARTSFFQLEGLSRIYCNVQGKSFFEKLLTKVKNVEDALGLVDYYAVFYKAFKDEKIIPDYIKEITFKLYKDACKKSNDILHADGWLDGSRLKKIDQKLKDIDWLKTEEEIAEIGKYIHGEIKDVEDFIKIALDNLDDIEYDIHEARRKIRWISIYAQVMNGGVMLHGDGKMDVALKKYQTDDVKNSPFNVLPFTPKGVEPILFSKAHFYAVSHIIKALSKIKDVGLKHHLIIDIIQSHNICSREEATIQCKKILGKEYKSNDSLLKDAEIILKTCIDDAVMSGLIKNIK